MLVNLNFYYVNNVNLMASWQRKGIYNNKQKKEFVPQYFVTETQTHPEGFTVYKVVCRVADTDSLDCFKESFIWKRYSDFKELYKSLAELHKKLYLNGTVPAFAKPKLFGRFEESVVKERKESAENVLKFATEHPPLYKSQPFCEFFKQLRPCSTATEIKHLKEAPLKPRKEKPASVETNPESTTPISPSALSDKDLELFDPFLSTKEFLASTSASQDLEWIEQTKRSVSQEGTNIQDSQSAGLCKELDSDEDVQLMKDLKITLSEAELSDYHKRQQNKFEASKFLPVEGDPVNGRSETSNGIKFEITGDNMEADNILDEEARELHRKSSKASAYLESVLKRNRLESESGGGEDEKEKPKTPDAITNPTVAVKDLVEPMSLGMTKKNSLLDLPLLWRDDDIDEEKKGTYLTQAAQQISYARAAEQRGAFEEAFGHYKTAINTLLQGVQDDTNEIRIEAVRRKTAAYLKRAEDIHSDHLKSTFSKNDLWKAETQEQRSESPNPTNHSLEKQRVRRDTSSPVPALPSPRHHSKDLSCYKVIGSIGKILLVLDTRSNETYALKILLKSCKNRLKKGVIPTNVPFMVRLHRYYSTEHTVCMLLEHASGGKLWDYLASYFQLSKRQSDDFTGRNIRNKPLNALPNRIQSSTPRKLPPDLSLEQEIEKDQEEVDQCSPSFLEICMEYEKEKKIGAPIAADTNKTQSDPKHTSPSLEEAQDFYDSAIKSETNVQNQATPGQIKRTWSYLSWDEVATPHTDAQPNDPILNLSSDTGIVNALKEQPPIDFKTVSSHSDMKFFTIGQEDVADPTAEFLEDSIYDSHSTELSEDSDDDLSEKERFAHELLSEQDMSAVSFCGDNMEKTLPSHLLESKEIARRGSPTFTRLIDNTRGSPCLSMNSSFEEDATIDDKEAVGQVSSQSHVTRVVDENGVSSVDAVSLFRTHSRTKSVASMSENQNFFCEEDDGVKEVGELAENLDVQYEDDNTKIHSIFVGMDIAKEKSLSYKIPESTVRLWAAEIVVAVGTLHSVAILCRDLNPDNILLSSDGHIRLSYFGKWKQVERKPCNKRAVNRMYVAPEMSLVNEKKTEACDWWSFGAILYELLTGEALCEAHPCGINSHTILSLPDHLSPEAKSLLTALLQYHPTQRLGYGVKGLDDLMDHPFFEGIEWDFLIEDYVGS